MKEGASTAVRFLNLAHATIFRNEFAASLCFDMLSYATLVALVSVGARGRGPAAATLFTGSIGFGSDGVRTSRQTVRLLAICLRCERSKPHTRGPPELVLGPAA